MCWRQLCSFKMHVEKASYDVKNPIATRDTSFVHSRFGLPRRRCDLEGFTASSESNTSCRTGHSSGRRANTNSIRKQQHGTQTQTQTQRQTHTEAKAKTTTTTSSR